MEWNGWEPVSTFGVEDQILTLTYPLNGEHEHTFQVTGQRCAYLRTGYIFLVVLYDCFCKVCGIGRSCRSISSQPFVGSWRRGTTFSPLLWRFSSDQVPIFFKSGILSNTWCTLRGTSSVAGLSFGRWWCRIRRTGEATDSGRRSL